VYNFIPLHDYSCGDHWCLHINCVGLAVGQELIKTKSGYFKGVESSSN